MFTLIIVEIQYTNGIVDDGKTSVASTAKSSVDIVTRKLIRSWD